MPIVADTNIFLLGWIKLVWMSTVLARKNWNKYQDRAGLPPVNNIITYIERARVKEEDRTRGIVQGV